MNEWDKTKSIVGDLSQTHTRELQHIVQHHLHHQLNNIICNIQQYIFSSSFFVCLFCLGLRNMRESFGPDTNSVHHHFSFLFTIYGQFKHHHFVCFRGHPITAQIKYSTAQESRVWAGAGGGCYLGDLGGGTKSRSWDVRASGFLRCGRLLS